MTLLLTGGPKSEVAAAVASTCKASNVPFVYASRKGDGEGSPAVKFDWSDSSTYSAPFDHSSQISAVLIIAPPPLSDKVNEFIDFASKKGVERFVLIAGSSAEKGGPAYGQIWHHLVEKNLDYCVLRPTWFNENFFDPFFHLHPIKNEGKFYTAMEDGKVPFVSTKDIGAVAFRALTDKQSHNCDHRVLGPELLTYDQTAEILSKVLGRKIEHVRITAEQKKESLSQYGLPEELVNFLTWLETNTAAGGEERENNVVEEVTGKKPQSFEEFVRENKSAWE